MVMALTATSPPKARAWLLKQMCNTPSDRLMKKGAEPSVTISLSTGRRGRRFLRRIFRFVRLPKMNHSTHAKDANWLMTVASAAPRTPMPRVKMNSGLSAMFSAAPSIVVAIAVLAKPCVVM